MIKWHLYTLNFYLFFKCCFFSKKYGFNQIIAHSTKKSTFSIESVELSINRGLIIKQHGQSFTNNSTGVKQKRHASFLVVFTISLSSKDNWMMGTKPQNRENSHVRCVCHG